MQGRVRIRGNDVWRVIDSKENVYEAREKRRRWQWSGKNLNMSKEQARPHFCYKEVQDRGVSATCRRCRVEREGIGNKPVPSCARPVSPEMAVWRETPIVAKGREGVIERRLRNHPLDCPVCDQGGECDLQEQTRHYGTDRSRRYEGGRKRSVEDKEIGGQVKIVMTRCIHCTRCVRYSQGQRGMRGRGTHSEIGRYTPWSRRDNPRSGGRVDRCPVGARTQEATKFVDRSWERETVESVNRRDARGQPVSLSYRGGKRIEVKPKRGSYEIVSDKGRYGRDGTQHRRRESVSIVSQSVISQVITDMKDSVSLGLELELEGINRRCDNRKRNSFHIENGLENNGYKDIYKDIYKDLSIKRSVKVNKLEGLDDFVLLNERHTGIIRRGSGVDRERGKERKSRSRSINDSAEKMDRVPSPSPRPRATLERSKLRRHRGERRVNVNSVGSKRFVGRNIGDVRPTRVYGAMGREFQRGVGSGQQYHRTLEGRKDRRDGKIYDSNQLERWRGSSRWQRGDSVAWIKKARGGEKLVQIRIHQPNGVARLTI